MPSTATVFHPLGATWIGRQQDPSGEVGASRVSAEATDTARNRNVHFGPKTASWRRKPVTARTPPHSRRAILIRVSGVESLLRHQFQFQTRRLGGARRWFETSRAHRPQTGTVPSRRV
jgi:hypothetical protein